MLPRKFTDARTYNMLVSVCVKAKDLTQALHAADMLKSTGRKLDTILYTNLISGKPYTWSLSRSILFITLSQELKSALWPAVCAAVGNADAAFELYAAMKAEAVKTEAQVTNLRIPASS